MALVKKPKTEKEESRQKAANRKTKTVEQKSISDVNKLSIKQKYIDKQHKIPLVYSVKFVENGVQ